MKPSRRTGLAAVFVSAVSAGTIASSSGNAIVIPIPRRKVRRGNAIFVIIMCLSSSSESQLQPCSTPSATGSNGRGAHPIRPLRVGHAHLERRALHHAENQTLEPVVIRGGVAHDLAHRRRIVVVDAA